MKNVMRLAPLLWLSVDVARAACEPKTEPVELPGLKIEKSEVRSLVLTPAAGTPIDRDTVIAVDLEYRVAGFSAGDFKLVALFKSGTYRSTSIDFDGKDSSVPLEHPAGRLRLCLPLAQIYGEDAEKVHWPLEVAFIILREDDSSGGSFSVGGTRPVALNTVDMPASALAKQDQAPPPEYDDALLYTFGHFGRQAAAYKTCLTRFPAMQPRLTPAYRAWETRHKADMDFVWELQFEALKEQFQGRTDMALRAIDHSPVLFQQNTESLETEELRGLCEEIIENGNPGTDGTQRQIGDYIAVLRQWRSGK